MSGPFDGLPKSLRIGPYDITFVVSDQIDDGDSVGQYTHGVSIELKRNQPGVVYAIDTVLHEINHAIYRTCGLEKKSSEESIVSAMAAGWLAIYRDNPTFLSWLQQTLPPRESG